MRRRDFIALVGSAAAAWPLAARAQQRSMPVIGYVHPGSHERERRQVDAFHRALSGAGYREGQNVAVEYRWAEGDFNRVPALLADLVRRHVSVIVAGGGTALAAKAAGTSIPIVGRSHQQPDPPHPLGLLRARRERPCCHCTCEQSDEIASPHGAYPKAKDQELIIAPCIAAKREGRS